MGTDSHTCQQSVITYLGQCFHKPVLGMCHVTEVLVNRRYLKMLTVSVYWVRGHN